MTLQGCPSNLYSPIFDAFCESVDKEYIYLCDIKANIWRWSPAAVEYFGLPSEIIDDLVAVWLSKVHPEDKLRVTAAFDELLTSNARTHSCEYRVKNAEGEYVWVLCRGCIAYDNKKSTDICAGVITHLSQNTKFDFATGLLSMAEFRSCVGEYITKGDKQCGILLIGIDHFRRINETHNYSFGGLVLLQFATKLSDMFKNSTHLFKFDGDKFAFICDNSDEAYIKQLFATAATLAQNGVIADGKHISLSISAGACFVPKDGASADAIHTALEHALEYSKTNNREGLTFFTEDLKRETVTRFKFEQTLKTCIEKDFEGFFLCYQPTVTADTEHKLIGAEALLRWRHPDFGLVSPAEIIPYLEASGKIIPVGKWVITTALTQVKSWLKILPELKISVNVSLIQFSDTSFRQFVLDEIERLQFPKKHLILELTESCNVIQPQVVRKELNLFRENDIQIALDDFGTGYASLSILRDLAADWIKVDHSFVAEIAHSDFDRALTESLINLCKRLDLSVCVEGIETDEIKDIIKNFSPKMMQGYLFSKPLESSVFESTYVTDN